MFGYKKINQHRGSRKLMDTIRYSTKLKTDYYMRKGKIDENVWAFYLRARDTFSPNSSEAEWITVYESHHSVFYKELTEDEIKYLAKKGLIRTKDYTVLQKSEEVKRYYVLKQDCLAYRDLIELFKEFEKIGLVSDDADPASSKKRVWRYLDKSSTKGGLSKTEIKGVIGMNALQSEFIRTLFREMNEDKELNS